MFDVGDGGAGVGEGLGVACHALVSLVLRVGALDVSHGGVAFVEEFEVEADADVGGGHLALLEAVEEVGHGCSFHGVHGVHGWAWVPGP